MDPSYEEARIAEEQMLRSGSIVMPWLKAALDAAPETGRVPSLARLAMGLRQSERRAEASGVDPEMVHVTLRVRYAWSLPTAELVDRIVADAEGSGILEVGSGSGYWAAILRHHTDVVAVDNGSWQEGREGAWAQPVRMDAAEAVRAHPERLVLSVFPDQGNMGPDVVAALRPGTPFVVVGPRFCTGSQRFHQDLDRWFDLEGEMRSRPRNGAEPADVEILRKRAVPLEQPRVRADDARDTHAIMRQLAQRLKAQRASADRER